MGDLLANHESARSCSAVMLGCPPSPVNCLVRKWPGVIKDLRQVADLQQSDPSQTVRFRPAHVLSV